MLVSTPDIDYALSNQQVQHSYTVRTYMSKNESLPSFFALNEHVRRLLNEFKYLSDNWDQDGAAKPAESVITQALGLVETLEASAQKVFHVAPGPNGEIMVDLRANDKSVEIIFYPDKSVYVMFPANGKPSQGEYSDEYLPNILKWLNSYA
jgi:hypothetical protein